MQQERQKADFANMIADALAKQQAAFQAQLQQLLPARPQQQAAAKEEKKPPAQQKSAQTPGLFGDDDDSTAFLFSKGKPTTTTTTTTTATTSKPVATADDSDDDDDDDDDEDDADDDLFGGGSRYKPKVKVAPAAVAAPVTSGAASTATKKATASSIFDDLEIDDDLLLPLSARGKASSKKNDTTKTSTAASTTTTASTASTTASTTSTTLTTPRDGAPAAHVVAKALGLNANAADEWSDEEVEVETLRLVLTNNNELRALEDLHVRRPARSLKRDVAAMSTLSKANSTALKDAVGYFGAGDYSALAGRVRVLASRGARVLFYPLDSSAAWTFAVNDSDVLRPVCVDGLGASQVLFLVLSGVKRNLGVAEGRLFFFSSFFVYFCLFACLLVHVCL